MPNALLRPRWKLAIVFAILLLLAVGIRVGLHAWRNRPPDNWREVRSPDGHYRLVITEEGAGLPGRTCLKDVYVLRAVDELDRDDDDSHVFAGPCGGLLDVNWSGGSHVEARVDHRAARQDGRELMLRSIAAGGRVRLRWSS